MFVDSVAFEPLADAPAALLERWKMRVTVTGGGFEIRAMPIVVTVGEQHAQMLVPLVAEDGAVVGLQGLLPEVPEAGAEVSVGYADGPVFATGFEFSETPA